MTEQSKIEELEQRLSDMTLELAERIEDLEAELMSLQALEE